MSLSPRRSYVQCFDDYSDEAGRIAWINRKILLRFVTGKPLLAVSFCDTTASMPIGIVRCGKMREARALTPNNSKRMNSVTPDFWR
jgi:hypothetical protein